MSKTKKPAPKFRVGDWVSFPFGRERATARVIEDRGPLGVNGRWIYRVRLELPLTDPMEFELAEDMVEAATPPAE